MLYLNIVLTLQVKALHSHLTLTNVVFESDKKPIEDKIEKHLTLTNVVFE